MDKSAAAGLVSAYGSVERLIGIMSKCDGCQKYIEELNGICEDLCGCIASVISNDSVSLAISSEPVGHGVMPLATLPDE